MVTDRTGPQPAAQDDTTRTTPRTPVRTCVGCRGTDSWSALLRVVAEKDETGETRLVPDPWRCLPGRGAWLHPDLSCLDLAVRRRAFGRALRSSTPPDHTAVDDWVRAHEQEPPSESKNRKRV